MGVHLNPPIEALRSHLPPAVVIGAPDYVAHRIDDVGIGDGTSGGSASAPCPVGSCGNHAALLAQNPADRLDRKTVGAHLIYERHDRRLRGSSSPAKKVVAAFRMATSSRNSLFSALSRLISADSFEVVPERAPASTCAARPTDVPSPHRHRPSVSRPGWQSADPISGRETAPRERDSCRTGRPAHRRRCSDGAIPYLFR